MRLPHAEMEPNMPIIEPDIESSWISRKSRLWFIASNAPVVKPFYTKFNTPADL